MTEKVPETSSHDKSVPGAVILQDHRFCTSWTLFLRLIVRCSGSSLVQLRHTKDERLYRTKNKGVQAHGGTKHKHSTLCRLEARLAVFLSSAVVYYNHISNPAPRLIDKDNVSQLVSGHTLPHSRNTQCGVKLFLEDDGTRQALKASIRALLFTHCKLLFVLNRVLLAIFSPQLQSSTYQCTLTCQCNGHAHNACRVFKSTCVCKGRCHMHAGAAYRANMPPDNTPLDESSLDPVVGYLKTVSQALEKHAHSHLTGKGLSLVTTSVLKGEVWQRVAGKYITQVRDCGVIRIFVELIRLSECFICSIRLPGFSSQLFKSKHLVCSNVSNPLLHLHCLFAG